MKEIEAVQQMLERNPNTGRRRVARELGVTDYEARILLAVTRGVQEKEATFDPSQYVSTARRMLKRSAVSHGTLQDALDLLPYQVDQVLEEIERTHVVHSHGSLLTLGLPDRGFIRRDVFTEDWVRVGLVSDTHLACREERLDALRSVYENFAEEGITDVYHAGNLVEGYIPRINGASVICSTSDDQIQYVIDNYPQLDGITTHFITGDDHEGWWIKEGHNWGREMMLVAQSQGRNDLHYVGHVEGDVEFRNSGGSTVMKVQHPGGGSAYARSYKAQKQVEAFQGGEKPGILVQGHYHVSNFMHDRNVYVVNMPGFQDQTVFARKFKLRMEIGGAILEFKQNPHDGSITRCRIDWMMFFDRGYYKPFLRSDVETVEKGRLVIRT